MHPLLVLSFMPLMSPLNGKYIDCLRRGVNPHQAEMGEKDAEAPAVPLNATTAKASTHGLPEPDAGDTTVDFGRVLEKRRTVPVPVPGPGGASPPRRLVRTAWQLQGRLAQLLGPLLREAVVPVPRQLSAGSKWKPGQVRTRPENTVSIRYGYILVAASAIFFDREVGVGLAVLLAQPVAQLVGVPEWVGIGLVMLLGLLPWP
mmetsp:Transcript_6636/g.18891  ORF Transcript_6636/g.18891 Transcript_6636/m.18891 type:complete len:203 (+) Transcript_6636:310-918(+)|eukprot:CAMPEP_0118863652 /NCGR_PEP_ID=MMETSP1163-20130328/8444_1 /TAXON_ID=124430 /ORGANISM="Phaeomonas parva, Strain CCMP2877" /LENGTH=202 /DNA_ID=CAMNT_0006797681 /DNA_START=208 /DNA_END=819 /DNA_ORIENTATION=-